MAQRFFPCACACACAFAFPFPSAQFQPQLLCHPQVTLTSATNSCTPLAKAKAKAKAKPRIRKVSTHCASHDHHLPDKVGRAALHLPNESGSQILKAGSYDETPAPTISRTTTPSPSQHNNSQQNRDSTQPSLCIAVIGATGELARTKVFPALFALYYSGHLPQNVGIFGYSRKKLSDMDLRDMIAGTLTCRVDHHENCEDKLEKFLSQTYHIDGGYCNKEGMRKLNAKMKQIEGEREANRIFYLSVPQEALLDVSLTLADGAKSKCGWNRIIIEKPFGFDAISSQRITNSLQSKYEESQIYRLSSPKNVV